MNIDCFVNHIKSFSDIKPEIGIVLGSGLGDFVKKIINPNCINYKDIKKYPISTVKGHEGQFILGNIENKSIICAEGRFHLYEGYDIQTTTLPIDIFNKMGCKIVIITNAAGCLNPNWVLGSLMLITRCIDFTFQNKKNPSIYFENHTLANNKVLNIINSLNSTYNIYKGTYSWVLGPTYETPSEVEKIKEYGGDVVGMSTMPEILKADEYGMDIIGLSCLSNYASGISQDPLTHQDVLNEVKKSKNIFTNLLLDLIKLIKL